MAAAPWLALCLALSRPAPARLVLGLEPGPWLSMAAQPQVQALVGALAGVEVRRLPFGLVVDVADGPTALRHAATLPGVRWLEEDVMLHIQLRHTPNDPLYAQQWHLHPSDLAAPGVDLGMPDAWDAVTSGIAPVVAVIDDGFDLTHPDLIGRYAATGLNVADDPTNDNPAATRQDHHGTQVAGVLAATGNNNVGGVGVCPQCTILPIRLTGGGSPPELLISGSAAAEAIAWAVDHGADVINNSWGPDDRDLNDPFGPSTLHRLPQSIAEALRYAATHGRGGLGTVVIWAAGNGNALATYDRFASDPRVISVGALGPGGRQAFYSNYGPTVMLSAPSNGRQRAITTTDLQGHAGASGDDYATTFGGTSAAAAEVAGVAALVLAQFPHLTAAQVTEALQRSAYPIDAARGHYVQGRSEIYGYGRVDLLGALQLAAGYGGPTTHDLEICDNGLDDDGNGIIDDPTRCNACIPNNDREICDGLDNNCDGRIDELFACQPTQRPLCAPCASTPDCASGSQCVHIDGLFGTYCLRVCQSDVDCPNAFPHCTGGQCAFVATPEVQTCLDYYRCYLPERCDGIDSDCNGVVDDVDPVGVEATASHAACTAGAASPGPLSAAVCRDGRWQCVTSQAPTAGSGAFGCTASPPAWAAILACLAVLRRPRRPARRAELRKSCGVPSVEPPRSNQT